MKNQKSNILVLLTFKFERLNSTFNTSTISTHPTTCILATFWRSLNIQLNRLAFYSSHIYSDRKHGYPPCFPKVIAYIQLEGRRFGHLKIKKRGGGGEHGSSRQGCIKSNPGETRLPGSRGVGVGIEYMLEAGRDSPPPSWTPVKTAKAYYYFYVWPCWSAAL